MSKNKAKNKKKNNEKEMGQKKSSREDRNWHRNWIRRGILALLCLFAVVLALYWMPAELHYTLTQKFTFSVDEAAVVYLKVVLPASNPNQTVYEPDVTWPGVWEVETQGRMDVLRLVATLQKGETVEAEISYRTDLFQGSADWTGDPIRSDDLSPTAVIQSDAQEVLDHAAAMGVEGNERATVRNFFNFVRRDADMQTGGPDAQINQLVALSRAVNIPARRISGTVLPDSLPFFRVSLEDDGSNDLWSEIQFGDAWHQVDPIRAGAFYQRNLLGWTDGRHLTYDTPTRLAAELQSQQDEASAHGAWQASGLGDFPFTAWADLAEEEGHLTRTVSVQKNWDGRWMMLLASIVILLVLNWMIESDQVKRNRQYHKEKDE